MIIVLIAVSMPLVAPKRWQLLVVAAEASGTVHDTFIASVGKLASFNLTVTRVAFGRSW